MLLKLRVSTSSTASLGGEDGWVIVRGDFVAHFDVCNVVVFTHLTTTCLEMSFSGKSHVFTEQSKGGEGVSALP